MSSGEPAKVRRLSLGSGGRATEITGPDALQLPSSEVCWIDLENPIESDLAILGQRYGFHRLAIEDCLSGRQRPKAEEYDQHLFLVLHEAGKGQGGVVHFSELEVFIGRQFLVTVHREPMPTLETIWKRVFGDPNSGGYESDYILYLLLDAGVDETFEVIDSLSDALLKIENQLVASEDGVELKQLIRLKRSMVAIRHMLTGEREVLTTLLRRTGAPVSARVVPFFRDVYDHIVRAHEQVDIERDLLGNAMEAYLSTVSNRLNVVMKQLTVLSAIFLPPTF